jgi:hypothetical protein
MKTRTILSIAALLSVACTSEKVAERSAPPPAAPAVAEKPADETGKFPEKNRVAVRIDDPHILGKGMLPAGNVAAYKDKDVSYQLFLAKAKSPEAAAIMLFDLKNSLGVAKYVPSFGGYYGVDNGAPLFVFQKGSYVVGVTGLLEKDADPIAREFAARLR